MTGTRQRTFTRQQLDEARWAWDTGEYRPEFWSEFRRLAQQAGIIVPPVGDRWDSWGDAHPSERALVARAIEDSPTLLRGILRRPDVHTWAQVVRLLLRHRDVLAEDAIDAEQDWQARKLERMKPLGDVARTILDSFR